MERKLAELDGLEIVHDREDTLLHLTGILGTEDDHLHSLEVDPDGGGGSHTGGESVGRELTSIVDDEIGLAEIFEFLRSRSNEHVVLGIKLESGSGSGQEMTHHEEGVVGSGSNDSDLDSVFGIPAGETIEDIDIFSSIEVVDSSFSVDLESVFARPPSAKI